LLSNGIDSFFRGSFALASGKYLTDGDPVKVKALIDILKFLPWDADVFLRVSDDRWSLLEQSGITMPEMIVDLETGCAFRPGTLPLGLPAPAPARVVILEN
jgi:hypothetical protein